MNTIWQDIRYALRTLVKAPAFTLAAVVSLALGIGANTTIFTLISTLFLNPLPVERPSELVAVFTKASDQATQFGGLLPMSFPNLRDFQERNDALSGLAAYSPPLPLSMSIAESAALNGVDAPSSVEGPVGTSHEGPERVFAQLVTGNYFEVLGVRPAAGRLFTADEDRTRGALPVAVIGYGLWQRRFGGRSDTVGRTIALNRQTFTIVAIAPEGFKGVTSLFGPELWLPSSMSPSLQPKQSASWLDERAAIVFNTVGRLKPSVSIEQADARFKAVARALEQEYPRVNAGRSVDVLPITESTIFPGMRGAMMFAGGVLMVIVALVLLVACSNVANLLLARATARGQEIAVRLALGATRRRLIQQLVTESIVLAVAGGALGFLFGIWGRDLLWAARPAMVANNFVELRIDGRVFTFALLLSVVTGIVFGLVPALRASRPGLVGALKSAPLLTAGRRVSLGKILVAGQVALSLVALVTAALFLRSLSHAHSVDLGYDTNPLAVVQVNLTQAGYDEARGREFARVARERMAELPGVSGVAWSSSLPLWANLYRRISIDGRAPARDSDMPLALVNIVDQGYFKVLGVGVLRGRDFSGADHEQSMRVAVVNERMAEWFWPGEDPIGRTFRFDSESVERQVIGVVRTVKYQTLGETPQPAAYLPLGQNYADGLTMYVRAERDASRAIGMIQRELRALDPQIPLENVATVDTLIDQSLWMVRIAAGLLGAFGGLALVLASVGLYGLIAYSVNQRRREIGIRMALGAGRAAISHMIMRDGLSLIGIGIAGGLGLSLLAGRALASLLLGISGADPAAFASACGVLAIVGIMGSYWPARAASRVDPLSAIRE